MASCFCYEIAIAIKRLVIYFSDARLEKLTNHTSFFPFYPFDDSALMQMCIVMVENNLSKLSVEDLFGKMKSNILLDGALTTKVRSHGKIIFSKNQVCTIKCMLHIIDYSIISIFFSKNMIEVWSVNEIWWTFFILCIYNLYVFVSFSSPSKMLNSMRNRKRMWQKKILEKTLILKIKAYLLYTITYNL